MAVIILGQQTLETLAPRPLKCPLGRAELTEKVHERLFVPQPILLLTGGTLLCS